MMAYYYPPNVGYVAQPVNRLSLGYYQQEQRQIPVIVPASNDYSYYGGAPSQQTKPIAPSAPQTSVNNTYPHVGSYDSVHQHQAAYMQPAPTNGYLQPQESQQSPQPSNGKPIDFLLLISYTILPLLKRKRRNSGKNNSNAVQDATAQSFPCTQCDKVFQKPYNLKLHMKTHSTDKPFTCSYCDRKFARLHDKKRHESLHGGVKNFKCEGYLKDGVSKWGCGKKFARSDALLRHFRTETGWLCIKPLMDEAKETDSHNPFLQSHLPLHSNFSHQVPDSIVENSLPPNGQTTSPHMNMSVPSIGYLQNGGRVAGQLQTPAYEQELVANTKLIRKLIQKY